MLAPPPPTIKVPSGFPAPVPEPVLPVPAPELTLTLLLWDGAGAGGEQSAGCTADLEQAPQVQRLLRRRRTRRGARPLPRGMYAFHPDTGNPRGLCRGLGPLAGTYPLGSTVPVLRDRPAFRADARRGALGRHQGGPLVARFLLTVRGHEREHGPAAGRTCKKEQRGPRSTALRGEGGRGLKGRLEAALSPRRKSYDTTTPQGAVSNDCCKTAVLKSHRPGGRGPEGDWPQAIHATGKPHNWKSQGRSKLSARSFIQSTNIG